MKHSNKKVVKDLLTNVNRKRNLKVVLKKVILKNMRPTTDVNELKAEIEAHDHKVINITNILETRTKKLLFFYRTATKRK